MAMVRGNVSVHLSDHSEIDMADKGNHTDVISSLQLDATKPSVSYIRGVAEHETARICEVCD